MKKTALSLMVAAGAAVPAVWLGASFATTPDLSDPSGGALWVVDPGHPDSHRLGELVEGEAPLPDWELRQSGAGLLVLAE